MRRTRWIIWSLVALLALGPVSVLADTLPVSPIGIIGPAGTIYYFTASRPVTNTTTATTLVSLIIPAAQWATGAASNTTFANLGPQNSTIPLHLQLFGLMTRVSGTINLSVNYGVGTVTNVIGSTGGFATIPLINGYSPNGTLTVSPGVNVAAGGIPVTIDVWLNPIATNNDTTATPNLINTTIMNARAEWTELVTPTATAAIFNAATIAQVNTASAHILNVIWQWGTASGGNTFILYRSILKQGF